MSAVIKKIIIYIPQKWQKKIIMKVTEGKICCGEEREVIYENIFKGSGWRIDYCNGDFRN